MSESIIDFGRVCRGESQVRKLSLRNTGALGTELTIRKVGREMKWMSRATLTAVHYTFVYFCETLRTYVCMHLSVVSAASLIVALFAFKWNIAGVCVCTYISCVLLYIFHYVRT